MHDKEITNDVLSMLKGSLTTYAQAIAESCSQQLRQTLSQIRDSDEQFQFQLSQFATQKGFYPVSSAASSQEIQQTFSQLQNSGTPSN